MATRLKHYIRVGVRYVIAAVLIVALSQLLIFINIIGDTFWEKVAITLVSLVIAALILGAAYQPK